MTATPILRLPRALLVDFGGVLVETTNQPEWAKTLAEMLMRRMAAECEVPSEFTVGEIECDIVNGSIADSKWKDAMSRPFSPAELTYTQFWCDFVAADWPSGPREFVRENAKELCRMMGEIRQTRVLRPGILKVLDAADASSIPVGIVSNALMGQVHRDYVQRHELTDRLAAQIYSDEVGIRKPNPEIIRLGALSVGVDVGECWYVGDNFDRDVLCGWRAGVCGNILMEANNTYNRPYNLRIHPDAIVANPHELLSLLEASESRSES